MLFGGFNIKSRIILKNADYKKFLKLYDNIPNKSEHVMLDIIDLRIGHLVELYNSCDDFIKHQYKKRLEMILQQNFDLKIKLDWPNIVDNLIIKRTCYYITRNKEVIAKLLPITVLLEMELSETIKYYNENRFKKINGKYSDIANLYEDLSEEDKLEIKLWIISYFNEDESLSKEVISKYLQPDLNIYEIVKLNRKNASGKKFLLELLKEIAIHSVVFENSKKFIIK